MPTLNLRRDNNRARRTPPNPKPRLNPEELGRGRLSGQAASNVQQGLKAKQGIGAKLRGAAGFGARKLLAPALTAGYAAYQAAPYVAAAKDTLLPSGDRPNLDYATNLRLRQEALRRQSLTGANEAPMYIPRNATPGQINSMLDVTDNTRAQSLSGGLRSLEEAQGQTPAQRLRRGGVGFGAGGEVAVQAPEQLNQAVIERGGRPVLTPAPGSADAQGNPLGATIGGRFRTQADVEADAASRTSVIPGRTAAEQAAIDRNVQGFDNAASALRSLRTAQTTALDGRAPRTEAEQQAFLRRGPQGIRGRGILDQLQLTAAEQRRGLPAGALRGAAQ